MKRTPIKNYWISFDVLMNWKPCKYRWTRKNVLAWFAGRKKVRLSTVLRDNNISDIDRDWVVGKIYQTTNEIPLEWWARAPEVSIAEILAAIE